MVDAKQFLLLRRRQKGADEAVCRLDLEMKLFLDIAVNRVFEHLALDAWNQLDWHIRILDDDGIAVHLTQAHDIIDEVIRRDVELFRDLCRRVDDVKAHDLRRNLMPFEDFRET